MHVCRLVSAYAAFCRQCHQKGLRQETSGQENPHAGKKGPHAGKTRPEENSTTMSSSAAFVTSQLADKKIAPRGLMLSLRMPMRPFVPPF